MRLANVQHMSHIALPVIKQNLYLLFQTYVSIANGKIKLLFLFRPVFRLQRWHKMFFVMNTSRVLGNYRKIIVFSF